MKIFDEEICVGNIHDRVRASAVVNIPVKITYRRGTAKEDKISKIVIVNAVDDTISVGIAANLRHSIGKCRSSRFYIKILIVGGNYTQSIEFDLALYLIVDRRPFCFTRDNRGPEEQEGHAAEIQHLTHIYLRNSCQLIL